MTTSRGSRWKFDTPPSPCPPQTAGACQVAPPLAQRRARGRVVRIFGALSSARLSEEPALRSRCRVRFGFTVSGGGVIHLRAQRGTGTPD